MLQSASGGLLAKDFPTLQEKTKTNAEAITKMFGKPMSVAELRQVSAEEFISRKVDEKTALFNALQKAIGSFVIDDTLITKESVNLLSPGALDGIEPPRLCRRPQLVRSRVHDKQDDEQIFT